MVSSRKALCVGINQYKNYPGSALQGCVNDTNDMEGILKQYLGFSSSDIVKLTDAQATKENVMGQLTAMVNEAKAGKYSYLVFSLSGHGTQVPDASGDEPDRVDEAFCPYDLAQKGSQWDPDHVINDDELHDLFVQLPKKVLLEVFLDTCHSGTGLKAVDLLLDRKPKYMPPPSLDGFKELQSKSIWQTLYSLLVGKRITHHILWAACRADQTSADAYIAGAWHGAFTYYFCKELRASNNSLSRKALLQKVNADLQANDFTQRAQLESQATVRGRVFG